MLCFIHWFFNFALCVGCKFSNLFRCSWFTVVKRFLFIFRTCFCSYCFETYNYVHASGLKKRRVTGKTHPQMIGMACDRLLKLNEGAETTASLKRPASAKAGSKKKPAAADGLVRIPTCVSKSFGKLRMHNSVRRSYIQVVLDTGRYECLWSASFRDHAVVTPLVFESLMDPGWTKETVAALKQHISLGEDPLAALYKLDDLAGKPVLEKARLAERELEDANEADDEGGESEQDAHSTDAELVSQEF